MNIISLVSQNFEEKKFLPNAATHASVGYISFICMHCFPVKFFIVSFRKNFCLRLPPYFGPLVVLHVSIVRKSLFDTLVHSGGSHMAGLI